MDRRRRKQRAMRVECYLFGQQSTDRNSSAAHTHYQAIIFGPEYRPHIAIAVASVKLVVVCARLIMLRSGNPWIFGLHFHCQGTNIVQHVPKTKHSHMIKFNFFNMQ